MHSQIEKIPASPSSAILPLPSADTPLGATILPGSKGVAFRVWAPNANAVSVIGEFNDWNDTAHPLAREDHGIWSGIVQEARAGQEYRYALRRCQDKFTRIDPRALKVTNSIGNGVIWDPTPTPAKKTATRKKIHCTHARPARHLRAAHRHVQRGPRQGSGHVCLRDREAPLPPRSRHQRRRGYAHRGVRRRYLLGLQPGPPVGG